MRRETAVLADYVALAAPSYRNAIMTNLLVRDLPDDVHAELQRRAAAEGQSLQRYVTRQLSRLVERTPPLADVLARIERHQGGTVGLAVAAEDLTDVRQPH